MKKEHATQSPSPTLHETGGAHRWHPAAIILIRAIVGGVFLLEGIQKFLFADALGVGRFIKIGIPAPEIMAPFVGCVEIVFGVLLLLGLLTRLACIPLLVNIVVAILTTKLPMLLHDGFWKMAHEARTDYAMVLGLIFLLLTGAGTWSLEYLISRRRVHQNQQKTEM